MLQLFTKDAGQKDQPSQAERLEEAGRNVEETRNNLLAVNQEFEEFAKQHNLIFDEDGLISSIRNSLLHFPPDVAIEYRKLSEKQNDAQREFHTALARYAELKN